MSGSCVQHIQLDAELLWSLQPAELAKPWSDMSKSLYLDAE